MFSLEWHVGEEMIKSSVYFSDQFRKTSYKRWDSRTCLLAMMRVLVRLEFKGNMMAAGTILTRALTPSEQWGIQFFWPRI